MKLATFDLDDLVLPYYSVILLSVRYLEHIVPALTPCHSKKRKNSCGTYLNNTEARKYFR
jgi:hypothetical protein